MPPKPIYEIPLSAYLFDKQLGKPEERVRQWAIFELLSTYGIHINNIKIEQKAKIGSQWKYADIVVYRNQRPHIIIECKKEDAKTPDEHLTQAFSYAERLGAEFAVYTDGHIWLVRRRLDGEWLPFPDIEKQSDQQSDVKIETALQMYNDLRPILFWLHSSIPAEEAKIFFIRFQNLLGPLLADVSFELRIGTKLLCQFIVRGAFSVKDNKQFIYESCDRYWRYFSEINFKQISTDPSQQNIYDLLYGLEYDLGTLVKNTPKFNHEEVKFIRVTLKIIRYILDELRNGRRIADVSEGLMDELHSLLEPICRSKLGVTLPDKIDGTGVLRNLCFDAWYAEDDLLEKSLEIKNSKWSLGRIFKRTG